MSEATTETALREQVELFLVRNFPQIQLHGGSASVLAADPQTGHVHVALGGACSGCGISPMTIQAVQQRLVAEFPEISTVETETGVPEDGGGFDPEDVPF
jgi:Fe-S cluster biogenesis protein NfuA